jgi:hypothetical protein
MKRISALVILISLSVALSAPVMSTPAHANGKIAATIDTLLGQSDYSYAKKTNNVWSIDFRGKSLSNFKVVISTGPDLVVMFVTVVPRKDIQVTPEAMQKLLKLNNNLDRVKIGFDADEDISVRIDLSDRVLDLQELKTNVEQLAASADVVYGAMMPFLNAGR